MNDPNEEYVRARWALVSCTKTLILGYCITAVIDSTPRQSIYLHCGVDSSESQAWQAAADFTRERERQIAETREEIDFLFEGAIAYQNVDVRKRILAMLNAKLAELTRGMKQEAGK